MYRLMKTAVAAVIMIGLASGVAVAQATTETVKGEITKVNLNERTLSLRDEKTNVLQRFRVEPGTEFTMNGKTVGLRDVRPGYDATLVVRRTADSLPVVVSLRMPNVPVDIPAAAQTATIKTVKGEITKVNLKEQTLSLRHEKTNELQRYRVEPNTEFAMSGKTVALRDVRPGYEATLDVRETADGLPVIVSLRMPKVSTEVQDKPLVAKATPPQPQPKPAAAPKPAASKPAPLPTRLPNTGGPLPLIGLLGAGAFALAGGLRAFRVRRSRFEN